MSVNFFSALIPCCLQIVSLLDNYKFRGKTNRPLKNFLIHGLQKENKNYLTKVRLNNLNKHNKLLKIAMLKKISLLIILALGLVALSPEAGVPYAALGKEAPTFLVESGDNRKLTLEIIRDKVIVLFYESRHVISKNGELKDELTKLYRVQSTNIKKEIFRLVVIDCTEATWPTIQLWKSKLKEHSKKEGFTIYGDWTRKMLTDYRLKTAESNFLIIDKQGIVRYSATGKIANSQFNEIKELLLTLVR